MTEKNQTHAASVPSGNGPTKGNPTGCDGEARGKKCGSFGCTRDAVKALSIVEGMEFSCAECWASDPRNPERRR